MSSKPKGVETDGLPEFYLISRTNAIEIYVGTGSHALWLCEQMMEAEVTAKIQAQKSERTDTRTGYRVRRFDTRMGTMYLFVPKLRKGGYVPFFVTAKSRAEAALIQVIQEAYIQGVSTRKIRKLASPLGIESISHSQVSQVTRELNEQVEAFRNRPPIQSCGWMPSTRKSETTIAL